MNYTKIKIVFKDHTSLYISEDEIVIFKLSGDYVNFAYLNDKDLLHRLDGPAIDVTDGSKYWYENGKRHRTGGLPAVEGVNGYKAWYENDKNYSQKQIEEKYNK